MAVFEYKGLNEAGKTVTGLKEADSPKGLRGVLRKDGIFLTDVLGQADATGKKVKGSKKTAGAVDACTIPFKGIAMDFMSFWITPLKRLSFWRWNICSA